MGAPKGNRNAAGRSNGGALTRELAAEVRSLLAAGARVDVVAHRFGISERHAKRIKAGACWKAPRAEDAAA